RDIIGDQPLNRGGRAEAPKMHLAHVADVEHTDRRARRVVVLEDPGPTRHRHLPAAEVHHLGAQPYVGFVERRPSHPADILNKTLREFKPRAEVQVTEKGTPVYTVTTISSADSFGELNRKNRSSPEEFFR